MDDAIAEFSAITGSTTEVATHFLTMTDGDTQQAIQLFFDSPELGAAVASDNPSTMPQRAQVPASRHISAGREDSKGVIHVDSDDDDIPMDDDEDEGAYIPDGPNSRPAVQPTYNPPPSRPTASVPFADYEDDEAMARRMQEELYAGGDMAGDMNEGVRAPLARTTETLVGPGADWGPEDIHEAVLQQMRARAQPRSTLEEMPKSYFRQLICA